MKFIAEKDGRLKVLGLPLYGAQAASTRHRLTQFVPRLADRGIDVEVMPLLGDDYVRRRFSTGKVGFSEVLSGFLSRLSQLSRQENYHCAWVQGELIPLMPAFLESSLLRIPYVYDFDDAFYLKYEAERFRWLRFFLSKKFDRFIGGATTVFPGNRTLLKHAEQFNDECVVVPTVIDHTRYKVRAPRGLDDTLNVGWIGSPSSIKCLQVLAPALALLAREGKVRLVVVGGVAPSIDGVEVVNLPWSEATEVEEICKFDVGVMPLEDEPWSRGKCAFKLIQYMACGVPVIGSRVGANSDVVTPECGFLAESTDDWLVALRRIRDNREESSVMGLHGRKRVVDNYSLESQVSAVEAGLRRAAKLRTSR